MKSALFIFSVLLLVSCSKANHFTSNKAISDCKSQHSFSRKGWEYQKFYDSDLVIFAPKNSIFTLSGSNTNQSFHANIEHFNWSGSTLSLADNTCKNDEDPFDLANHTSQIINLSKNKGLETGKIRPFCSLQPVDVIRFKNEIYFVQNTNDEDPIQSSDYEYAIGTVSLPLPDCLQ